MACPTPVRMDQPVSGPLCRADIVKCAPRGEHLDTTSSEYVTLFTVQRADHEITIADAWCRIRRLDPAFDLVTESTRSDRKFHCPCQLPGSGRQLSERFH